MGAMMVSDCCGAPATAEGCVETGLCPQCHEHCEFYDDEEEDEDAEATP